jgi:hypothetical protein
MKHWIHVQCGFCASPLNSFLAQNVGGAEGLDSSGHAEYETVGHWLDGVIRPHASMVGCGGAKFSDPEFLTEV